MVRRTMHCQRLEYLPWERTPSVSKTSLRNKHASQASASKVFGLVPVASVFFCLTSHGAFITHLVSEAVPSMSEYCKWKWERLLCQDLLLRAQYNLFSSLLPL